MDNKAHITGLKGIAAVMIVAFHLQFIYSSLPDFIHKVLAFNGVWVNMFFVLSAFTITASITRKNNFNLLQYLRTRYLRIAPAYYFMICIAFVTYPLVTTAFPLNEALYRLIPHALFLNTSPLDQTYQLLFLGTEWYIPVQFWFYVIAPFIIWIFRKNIILYGVVLCITIYLHFNMNALFRYEEYFDFASSIQNFLWVYVLSIGVALMTSKQYVYRSLRSIIGGIVLFAAYVFFVVQLTTSSERLYMGLLFIVFIYLIWGKTMLISKLKWFPKIVQSLVNNMDIVFLLVLLFKYILNWYFVRHSHEFMAIWSIVIVLASQYRPFISRILFENRVTVWIGNISYSIYLTHFFVLTMVGYIVPSFGPIARTLVIIPVTIMFSLFIHRYIEKKFNKNVLTTTNLKN